MFYWAIFIGLTALDWGWGFARHTSGGFHLPQTQVLEDLFDDVLILDHADDFHLRGTFGASQWVHFVNLLDQPCPILSALFR
jgi:hypothetical protein